MPRARAVHIDAIVDASVHARAGALIERSFSAADLPRLSEAGVRAESPAESRVGARLQFSLVDGRPAIDGALAGALAVTCQRCMKPVTVRLDQGFKLVLVDAEREDEPGGYEPVVVDPAHLDLRWLIEEEALLALPLAPMHESSDCAEAPNAPSEIGAEEDVRQKPFESLRDMLRER
jgi:uncharacterized protein